MSKKDEGGMIPLLSKPRIFSITEMDKYNTHVLSDYATQMHNMRLKVQMVIATPYDPRDGDTAIVFADNMSQEQIQKSLAHMAGLFQQQGNVGLVNGSKIIIP